MRPRIVLCVALIGLVMAGLCLATLFLLRDGKNPDVNAVGDLMILGIQSGSSFSWTWGRYWASTKRSSRNKSSCTQGIYRALAEARRSCQLASGIRPQ